ncbi:type II toxin-antitoxin system prevent-host-death family antitoxin [Diaminobutyricibacter tongyongensis]|uniref:Type II toxin-antitoxin system prevent-host-death family antitoxin n=1 Tax=Leifsonia tongyongensis TaxID=1268043 RepID=A0A6L9XTB0_9MICO|nr:type II toxin-antitoxin system prevent-host-death family antitoxin [Diaminobutyricibacter tongyongensis]
MRELRNHGGEILNRVQRGEHLTVTRDGAEIAELVPLGRPPQQISVLINRRRLIPRVDPVALRADIDTVIDQSI